MADDKALRRGRWAPMGMLSPGIIWLLLFFLVPVAMLLKASLSTKPSRFENPVFDWNFSNYADALSQYQPEFIRSFLYAGTATVLAIVIGYPLAYWIATQGGRYKNLLIGLVVVPFFTSYLIRTIAWTSILRDDGPFVSMYQLLPWVGDDGRILATPWAVIGGLTYNFISFMILPIYVSLEKIDFRLTEAAADLGSTAWGAFRKVVLPLSMPGVFAGSLLVFIPAAGDYINNRYLGSAKTSMIGTVVQNQFLVQVDFPQAAALSMVLMVIITVMVLIYSRFLGTEGLAV
ncbi:MAG TPA: ABC transporter permease [Microthrixaceae bacterium]|jgi:spermidine/putrescine transport system permease protein|nr:ABC transporter permease [Microthrixaceae bacterium]HNJ68815.1 ABC transporter permease [Microthrixaceae bacterium]HNL47650.1 ABC transporter permease [Microthrixaceae bacterium]HNN37803.1 ABC transporter permease [Microthrixaceae bacterium]HRW40217.1 ABC transporter permease [Microthrixaceae bacterium]